MPQEYVWISLEASFGALTLLLHEGFVENPYFSYIVFGPGCTMNPSLGYPRNLDFVMRETDYLGYEMEELDSSPAPHWTVLCL